MHELNKQKHPENEDELFIETSEEKNSLLLFLLINDLIFNLLHFEKWIVEASAAYLFTIKFKYIYYWFSLLNSMED